MKKISGTVSALILTIAVFALAYFSKEAKNGALQGIKLCEGVIIPSLLPVLIITNIMLKSRAASIFEALFGKAFEKALKLPKSAVLPVLFGLIGGYPAGAVLTAEQYNSGCLSQNDAAQIMRFNFCGGVAFIISAVGGGYYGSAKAGAVLYIINIISSVIIAAASSFFKKKRVEQSVKSKPLPFSQALCEAAQSASGSVILMSAYIVTFCALTNIVKLPQFIRPLLEITSGIFAGNSKMPLPYCAFFLAFGGFCIHLQLAGFLRKMGMKYGEFLLFRLISAVLSFLLAKAFVFIFPQSEAVFFNAAAAAQFQFTEANTAFGIIAMLGCALLVLDIEKQKLKL